MREFIMIKKNKLTSEERLMSIKYLLEREVDLLSDIKIGEQAQEEMKEVKRKLKTLMGEYLED